MGQTNGENTDFLVVRTQVHVLGTRHKLHRPRHEKILDGYDESKDNAIVGPLRAATNSICSYV